MFGKLFEKAVRKTVKDSENLDNASDPTIVAGTGAGTSPTLSITGNDDEGQITLTAGTTPAASQAIATVTFQGKYANRGRVVITPATSAAAAVAGVWVDTPDATGFVLRSGASALTAASSYKWNYIVAR